MNPSSVDYSLITKNQPLLKENQAIILSSVEVCNTLTDINNKAVTIKDESTSASVTAVIKRLLVQTGKLITNYFFKPETVDPKLPRLDNALTNGYSHNVHHAASSLPKPEKRRSLWLHNDSKLVTESCLLKLQKDLQDHSEIDISLVDYASRSGAGHYDSIFLFYYTAGGREISEALQAKVADVTAIFPQNTIHVIALRDADTKASIDTTKVLHKPFQIFTDSLNYSKLILHTNKAKCYEQRFLDKLHRNYDSLFQCIKTSL